ncbi:PspC domain-containing protein [Candidatus Woesearchaeota archaeon]|nr:PspC domain-containing protein [Candidatus Woesearchaeota archaeon]
MSKSTKSSRKTSSQTSSSPSPNHSSSNSSSNYSSHVKRLYRNSNDKVLGGVCSGVAEYFSIDPVLVRIVWVLATLVSMGFGIIAYLVAWIIMPEKQ